MRSHIGRLGAVALALAALGISACGSSSSSSSGTSASSGTSTTSSSSPFRVLMVADTSGPTKLYGVVQVAAMKGAAAYLNTTGGILGHKVTVSVINDNGDASTAASSLVKYLTSNSKPNLLFGGTGQESGALIPLATRHKILNMPATDGNSVCLHNGAKTCPTTYLTSSSSPAQMAATAAWFKQHHYTNVGILAQLNGLSQSENQYLLADLKAAGIRYTVATFPPTAVDVKPQISKLQAAGAQVIYGEALGPAAGYIGKGRAQLGLVSRPLVFDPGAGSEDLTKLMSAAELKNSYEVTWGANDPAQKYPGRDLLIKYAQPFGGVTAQPVSLGGFQWTDLILARNAAQQAKSIDTDAMVNALDHLSQKAQTDPLYLSARALLFTAENHEDAIPNGQAAYVVVPVGPLVGGLVKYR